MFRHFIPFLLCALALPVSGQTLVAPSDAPRLGQILQQAPSRNTFKCRVNSWEPSLDFNLRYVTGFTISAKYGEFAASSKLVAFLRVTPEGAEPVLLAERFDVPKMPAAARESDRAEFMKRGVRLSGAFALGEGRYHVEFLLMDAKGRSYHKRWSLNTGKYDVHLAPPAMKPLTVGEVENDHWNGKLTPHGLRLTVLLDATPIFPFALKLRPWDRAFLLQALASLLKQVPVSSVKLVAFNLDQQREIFRAESFDSPGFARLAAALEELELATISVTALRRDSFLPFLLRLTAEQTSSGAAGPLRDGSPAQASPLPDAVIFLGPTSRFDRPATKESLHSFELGPSRLFYFEYFAFRTPFPDTIDHLVRDLHGTVYHINTASEFAADVQKMLAQLHVGE